MSPLVEHCDRIIEKLRELAPRSLADGDEEAIHQARVATRRMRAALRLVRPLISDEQRKPLGGALRRLRRRLGDARDLDVMIGHLTSLKRASSHAAAIDWLQLRLHEARVGAQKKNHDDATSKILARLGAWWGVREEMSVKVDQLESLLGESLHRQLDEFTTRSNEITDPHELRIAGKSLRYTLEMAQAAGHPISKPTLRTFKKLQDALGLWHDYVVLEERAMRESADAMLAHHDATLQRGVLALTQLLLKRADSQLRKFKELWTTRGPEISSEIYAAFPIEPTRSQTDHDRSGSSALASPEVSQQDDHATV